MQGACRFRPVTDSGSFSGGAQVGGCWCIVLPVGLDSSDGASRGVPESGVDVDLDEDARRLTLSSAAFVLQIDEVDRDALRALTDVPDASWSERGSLHIGVCSGLAVFWCAGTAPGGATVLVGPDDETWSIAVEVPSDSMRKLLGLMRRMT